MSAKVPHILGATVPHHLSAEVSHHGQIALLTKELASLRSGGAKVILRGVGVRMSEVPL